MSADLTRRTIDSYLEALLTGGDFGAFFAEDVMWTTMENGELTRGRDAVVGLITAMHRELFDAHPEMRNIVVAPGAVALEADFIGTHTGEFAGIPATGAKIQVPYCITYELDGETITALRAYIPIAAMVAQLREAAAG